MKHAVMNAARFLVAVLAFVIFTGFSSNAAAQIAQTQTSPILLVLVVAALAIAPFILVMITSFVKIAVVLSLLRMAIGVQQVPPNQVITGLAIVLSIYIMAPVGLDVYAEVRPYIDQVESGTLEKSVDNYEGLATKALVPVRGFLMKHADEEERLLLYELALELRTEEQRANITNQDTMVLVPAFVLTELKEAFVIGFILFVPFLIVDLVVANILLSLGMHMLSPTTVSLPFKLLLFVLVDGWYLVIKGLILGYV